LGYRGHFSVDGKVGWEDRWTHMTAFERFLLVAALLNFIALFAAAMWLGGDAANGKIEHGRYFLGNRGHYHEVSAGVYYASLLHVLSLLITHPLGMFATWRGQKRAKRALNPEA
jgi:hypothetical protein